MTRGDRNIRWIEKHCCIPEGTHVGQPMKLRPWQRRVIRGIYNSYSRTAIISFARKNGKTALAGCLLLLHLVGPESIENSQLVSSALIREQAALVFGLAAKMVRMSPSLEPYVVIRDTAKQLFAPDRGTLYKALSADAPATMGLSPIFAIHDELGQVKGPKSDLYDAIETASGAYENPLSIIISTQAPDDGDLLSVLIDDAKTGRDKSIKLFLWTASENDDPFIIKTIKQANPALNDFLNQREIIRLANKAKRMPSFESSYRNLNLNQRVQRHDPFISRSIWDENSGEPDNEVLENAPSYIAIDLSARNDLTALIHVAVDDDGYVHVKPYIFSPGQTLADRVERDRVPYDIWAEQGYLQLTAGASVEYDEIADQLIYLYENCNVVGIAFDRWRIDVLEAALRRKSVELPLLPFGQGFKDMSPALDALESVLFNKKLRHGNHPILRWNAANAVVVKDPAGNRKLDKAKSSGRIDGMVGLAMGIGAMVKTGEPDDDVIDLPAGYKVAVI